MRMAPYLAYLRAKYGQIYRLPPAGVASAQPSTAHAS